MNERKKERKKEKKILLILSESNAGHPNGVVKIDILLNI